MNFISPAYAQTETPADAGAPVTAATEAHAGGHHVFPPFDPATFGSQLFWLVISFGALYLLMSRVALPRIGAILADRSNTIGADLGEAERLKSETDAAIAAYETALAEARQRAHGIGQAARDKSKAEAEQHRSTLEGELEGRISAAESRIAEVKNRALGDVDTIARETTAALVDALIGGGAAPAEIDAAVKAAAARSQA